MLFASRFGSTLYRDIAGIFLIAALAILQWSGASMIGLGTIAVLVIRALAAAQMLHAVLQLLQEKRPYIEDLIQRVEALEACRATVGNQGIQSLTTVAVHHVTYRYRDGVDALSDVSLTVDKGQVLGILGPSGGGKSTLTQVLARLRPPTTGSVTVNGQPYEEFDPRDWANLVSLVPQEPRLMEATIADNIRFFRSGISDEAIAVAARAAHIEQDIGALHDGYNTMLEPRGGGLSGGQKQRIAIARALAGNPELLVLDEPTSALDVQSERLLQSTISDLRGRVAVIMISHRLSALEICDQLVVVNDGRIEMVGTAPELSRVAGFYSAVANDSNGSGT
jgi:ABC-type multidrug transport system fused ATPase/permease subunit